MNENETVKYKTVGRITQNKNLRAFRNFNKGEKCVYCGHYDIFHRCNSAGFSFYRKASYEEMENPSIKKYVSKDMNDYDYLVKETIEKSITFPSKITCIVCAVLLNTQQVVCFSRNFGVGEILK